MIDTVKITLKEKDFSIIDHNKFNPSTEGLFSPPFLKVTKGAIFCIQNPTKEDYNNNVYKPRLTVIKSSRPGGFEILLSIEFSASKILFGNNFDELENSHLEDILAILRVRLEEMGVLVSVESLIHANVSSIHYSKNICLTDYSTPYSVLIELSKLNLSKILNCNKTDFRNEGHALKYHTNSFEIVFYDKLKDLKQAKISKKRSLESDGQIQLKLLSEELRKPFEVLRFEVRLNTRKKLKSVLEKCGIQILDLTFQNLFDKQIAKTVLLYYFDIINASYLNLVKAEFKSSKDFLFDILVNNPKLGLCKSLQCLGAKVLLDEIGVREYTEIIKQFSKRTGKRSITEFEQIRFNKIKPNPLDKLLTSLSEFRSIKINDFVKV